jgi:heptosyltransferase-2
MSLAPRPQRILVKQVNWLGDIVMSLPALRAVRRAYANAHLALLIKSELASFFEGSAWIDEVIPYRLRSGIAGLADRARIIADLRRRRFDTAILFPDSLDAAVWVAAAGIPVRTGYVRDARGWLLTHGVARTAAALRGHQVAYRLQMLESALGIEGDKGDVAPDVAVAARQAMQGWLAKSRKKTGKLIALAPVAAYGPAKEWPAAFWAALVNLLDERHGCECVLVGSPAERARCDAIHAACRGSSMVAAGETSIGELIALLSLCDGFAGNDSGAMHVAGALGIPTVGIFGSTSPERTGPLGPRTKVIYRGLECSPCLQRTCRFGHYNCLTEISVEEVCSRLTSML